MTEEIIEGEVTDIAIPEESKVMPIGDLVDHVAYIHDIQAKVMKADQHYGIIPGCKKPSLLKPGAEELCVAFQLRPEPVVLDAKLEADWIYYRVRCDLYHIPTGNKAGSGVGSCNSRESRYQRQIDKRKCSPYDIDNTILKMAKKRAQIDAVLSATGASDIFTQDLEDMPAGAIGDDASGATNTINEKQAKLIHVWLGIAGINSDSVKGRYGIEHFAELTKVQMDEIKDNLIKDDRLAFRKDEETGKEIAYNPREE